VALIWAFIKIQTNKNVDERTKKSSYFIILPIIAIAWQTIYKLMN